MFDDRPDDGADAGDAAVRRRLRAAGSGRRRTRLNVDESAHGGKLAAVRRTDFHYDLPEELIAQAPLAERSASRLLALDGATGALADRQFRELPAARRARRSAGLQRHARDSRAPVRAQGIRRQGRDAARAAARRRDGAGARARQQAAAPGDAAAEPRRRDPRPREARRPVGGRATGARARVLRALRRRCRCRRTSGASPMPPTARATRACSRARDGAVAAPTASLHFDAPLLAALEARGVRRAFVTLHVGAGTFQPVRTDAVGAHVMHAEFVEVSAAACEADRGDARARRPGHRGRHDGGARARERRGRRHRSRRTSATRRCSSCRVSGSASSTRMVTNFHLPESTLLMLVSAFAGRERVLAAYAHAVAARYRFFSYGDAMFVTPAPGAHLIA